MLEYQVQLACTFTNTTPTPTHTCALFWDCGSSRGKATNFLHDTFNPGTSTAIEDPDSPLLTSHSVKHQLLSKTASGFQKQYHQQES